MATMTGTAMAPYTPPTPSGLPFPGEAAILAGNRHAMEDTVLTVANELLSRLGLDVQDLSVVPDGDAPATFRVALRSADSKILIGPRGHTLDALEHLLGLAAERRAGTRLRVHVEVNDYRAAQDVRLLAYADDQVEAVRRTGGTLVLRPMSSYERKKVHAHVSAKGIPGLSTSSQDTPQGRLMHLAYDAPSAVLSPPSPAATAIDLESAGI